MYPFLWVRGTAYVTWSCLVKIYWAPICDHLFRSTGEITQACNRHLGKGEILWNSHTPWVDSFLVHIGIHRFLLWTIFPLSPDLCYGRFEGETGFGEITTSLFLAISSVTYIKLTSLPLWSAYCVDHAWVELPGNWSRRVFGPEDCPVVDAGERSGGDQGPGQVLQTRNQGAILQ